MFLGTVLPADVTALALAVERARIGCGMKHDTLAHLMGVSSTQLSDQLAGRRSQQVSLGRLLAVSRDADGKRFWSALLTELATVTGTERDEPVTLLRRALALLTKPQMVKADTATKAEKVA